MYNAEYKKNKHHIVTFETSSIIFCLQGLKVWIKKWF